MTDLAWQTHPDGTFDLHAGGITLRGAYPALDHAPVRPLTVTAGVDFLRYGLRDDAELLLRFAAEAGTVVIRAELAGSGTAPHWVHPVHGARIEGATRWFRHGLGFAGPSGFVELSRAELFSYESHVVSALVAPEGGALAVAADTHGDFLQKSQVHNRLYRDHLENRRVDDAPAYLECGFATERIAFPADGGPLTLPALRFHHRPTAWTALRAAVAELPARSEGARKLQPPTYFWCSWYQNACNFSATDLSSFLAGANRVGAAPQVIQMDDGYCPSPGDWLEPRESFCPGGLEHTFGEIRQHGYRAGIWIAPFMVGSRSRLFRDHPEWVLRDRVSGKPIAEWKNYNGTGIPTHVDEETYVLDTSHPGAMTHLETTFSTFRRWGATFFKTDFMDWGLKDSTQVLRHTPGKTSAQYFTDVLLMIRRCIGDESHWLGCIAPFAPLIGHVDGMRIANDTCPDWGPGAMRNILDETYYGQYFNRVLWENDPDVLFLRGNFHQFTDVEIETLALWRGILGGSISNSDRFHELTPERLRLWRFLQPAADLDTAAPPAFLPHWGEARTLRVAVRPYPVAGGWGVLVLNPGTERGVEEFRMRDLVGLENAPVFRWSPGGAEPLGELDHLVLTLPGHASRLFYVSRDGNPPPADLTLNGARLEAGTA